jgi:plastocyanin
LPNPIDIQVGDTVTWTNNDMQPHTVTSGTNAIADGNFDSSPDLTSLITPGQSFSHTFTKTGEYGYYCSLHPNMVGKVLVD